MPPRPELLHQSISNTLLPENPSESGKEDISVPDEGDATSYLLSPSIHGTLVSDMEGRIHVRARTNDMFSLAAICVMLVWPWIFLSIVWAREGLQVHNNVAKAVIDHPQTTSFVTTLFSNIISMIVSVLFSLAVVRFAQQWATNNEHITVFHISLISAFRHQNWPWGIDDHKYLLLPNRWFPVALAGACIAAFALVQPGTTSLITPVSFHRNVPLTGTELDFSANAADCIDWFTTNDKSQCNWKMSNGLRYFGCIQLKFPMVDILESGRSNIHSLFSNNSESFALSQLGANSSTLRFSGPVRGVLPIGPNSLPGFNTLQPSPLSDAETKAVMLSYNYTLDHQGLFSNISCIYDTLSPIRYSAVPNNTAMVEYSATCDGLADIYGSAMTFQAPDTYNFLGFWVCKSVPTGDEDTAYYIYLSGRNHYAANIGNITCTVSPIQPAIFPVTYQSTTGIFSTQDRIATSAPTSMSSVLIQQAIAALGGIVAEGQSKKSNLVVDLVIDLGVQALGLPPTELDERYLPLHAAMIQGILVNQVTYIRFLYSTSNPPPSCTRTVNGRLSAEVIGWVAKPVHIGFLMPMTILNLTSLIVILIAMVRAKRGCYGFDPTDPRPLVLAEPSLAEDDPSGWTDGLSYRPREFRENFSG